MFFDLVFVVAVAQLAAGLHEHLSPTGAAAFVGLFLPMAWTWTNGNNGWALVCFLVRSCRLEK